MLQKTPTAPNGANYADSRENRGQSSFGSFPTETEDSQMNAILTPARLKQLSALQGTRGVIGGLVSKSCLLTNGTYYVDVIGEVPSLVEAVSAKTGDLTYGDDDGNFSLAKLHNAVKSTIDRKRKDALASAAENGTTTTFPNVEAIRDDDASTVYIVNWDLAPDDDDESDDDDA